MNDFDLDALAAELSEFAPAPKTEGRSPRDERIIAGFEDIQRWVQTHGRVPTHGEERDIFERLYAVRLDRLRTLPDARELLTELDHQGLLNESGPDLEALQSLSDDELLAELDGVAGDSDIRVLKHVASREERQAAEEIAQRSRCGDFETFKPLFDKAQSDLQAGLLESRIYGQHISSAPDATSIAAGDFFIVGGQMAYVAEVGEAIKAPNGENDARLRVIYSNGTQSNLLRRSLQRALYKDEAGRRLVDVAGPNLFSGEWDEDDIASGSIYVLRSLSSHPYIAQHRELIHKIGVTGGSVEARIANAPHQAAYLLADVEVVATYKLASVNRTKLEALFHRIFAPAQLDLTIEDRFGHPVRPQEWFLVPLHVIDEAVQRIQDGSITGVIYDPMSATLVERRTP
jgi:hypothetical protein